MLRALGLGRKASADNESGASGSIASDNDDVESKKEGNTSDEDREIIPVLASSSVVLAPAISSEVLHDINREARVTRSNVSEEYGIETRHLTDPSAFDYESEAGDSENDPELRARYDNVKSAIQTAEGCSAAPHPAWSAPQKNLLALMVSEDGYLEQTPIAPPMRCLDKNSASSVLTQFSTLPLEQVHHFAFNGEYLNALFKDRKLVDLLVHVEDRTFYAHQCVVCAHSGYFSSVLVDSSVPPYAITDITLKSIDPEQFKKFLNFVYTGEIFITLSSVEGLRKLANKLKSKTLRAKIALFLSKEKTLTLDEALDILLYTLPDDDYMRPLAMETVVKHFKDLLMDPSKLCQISKDDLQYILQADNLNVDSELDAFWGVLYWVAIDPAGRATTLNRLMATVRFTTMSSLELMDCARVSELVRLSKRCQAFLINANWVCHVREVGLEDPLGLNKEQRRSCLTQAKPHEPTVAEFDMRFLVYNALLQDRQEPLVVPVGGGPDRKSREEYRTIILPSRKSIVNRKTVSFSREVKKPRSRSASSAKDKDKGEEKKADQKKDKDKKKDKESDKGKDKKKDKKSDKGKDKKKDKESDKDKDKKKDKESDKGKDKKKDKESKKGKDKKKDKDSDKSKDKKDKKKSKKDKKKKKSLGDDSDNNNTMDPGDAGGNSELEASENNNTLTTTPLFSRALSDLSASSANNNKTRPPMELPASVKRDESGSSGGSGSSDGSGSSSSSSVGVFSDSSLASEDKPVRVDPLQLWERTTTSSAELLLLGGDILQPWRSHTVSLTRSRQEEQTTWGDGREEEDLEEGEMSLRTPTSLEVLGESSSQKSLSLRHYGRAGQGRRDAISMSYTPRENMRQNYPTSGGSQNLSPEDWSGGRTSTPLMLRDYSPCENFNYDGHQRSSRNSLQGQTVVTDRPQQNFNHGAFQSSRSDDLTIQTLSASQDTMLESPHRCFYQERHEDSSGDEREYEGTRPRKLAPQSVTCDAHSLRRRFEPLNQRQTSEMCDIDNITPGQFDASSPSSSLTNRLQTDIQTDEEDLIDF